MLVRHECIAAASSDDCLYIEDLACFMTPLTKCCASEHVRRIPSKHLPLEEHATHILDV